VPYFAPELLRRVRLDDAMKAKKLRQALLELAEEGVVQLFRPRDGAGAAGGRGRRAAVGRAESAPCAEYGVGIGFEASTYNLARWISSPDRTALAKFIDETGAPSATMSTAIRCSWRPRRS